MLKRFLSIVFLILFMAVPVWAGIQKGSGGGTAAEVVYDNATSGLTADDLQSAIDELENEIDGVSAGGLSDLDDLPGDTVNDNLIDFALLAGVQAADDDLTTWAGVTPSANGQSLVAAANYAAMRSLLGLVVGTNVQAYDADLTTYAGITPSAAIQTFLTSADNSVARNNLGLAIGTNVQAYDADLTTYAGITPSANIQALLGSADYSAARTNLGLAIGTNVQAYDADLTTYAGVTPSANAQTLLGQTFAQMLSSIGAQAADSDLTTLAAISGSRGDIIYFGASGWTRLAKGTENYYLKQGANDPAWAEGGTGGASAIDDLTDVTITSAEQGDILYFNGSAWVNVIHGTAGQYLKTGGHAAAVSWDTPSGAGDMLAASYPDLVAIEAEPHTNTYMMVADGSQWQSVSPGDVRTNLGLVIGTNVQAYDADLTTYAGITPSANIQSFLGSADYATARTNLGLAIGTNVQAYDADLTTYAGITPSANIQSLLAAADYSAMRTLLSLVPGTNVQAYDADLATLATPTASRMYWSNGSQVQTAISLGSSGNVLYNNSGTPTFGAITAAMCPTAGANGSTLGVAAFTAADFNASAGVISIDYTNGTAAGAAAKGFLTSTDWSTFNAKAGTSSPTFTGTPAAPTAAADTNTTQIATTAFVIGQGYSKLVSPDFTTPDVNVATFTSLCQSGQTLGSNIIKTAGFSVDADGDVIGKSFSGVQVADQASDLILYAAEATPSGLYGFLRGPSAAPTGGSYGFQLATTLPTAGQSFKFGTVSSRIVPLGYTSYLELTGGTMTGKLITAATSGSAAGLNIPSGTAPSSPAAGDLYYDGTHLYFYTTSAIDLLAGGGATLSNISNPSANKSFTMAAYTLGFTSSTATWGGVSITNSAADPSAGALLTLDYSTSSNAADGQIVYLTCLNSADAEVFKVGPNGNTTIAGTLGVTGATTLTGATSVAGGITSTLVNAASGSASSVTLSGTLGIMNGSDTFRGLYVNYTNADHTGSFNNFYAIDVGGITGDAECTEYALNIGTGWDYSFITQSPSVYSVATRAYFRDGNTSIASLDADHLDITALTSLDLNVGSEDLLITSGTNSIAIATGTGVTGITLTSLNLSIGGDLTVTGNDITFGNAETISNATNGTILLTAPIVAVSAALDVQGGAITLQNDETIGNGDDTEISFNGTEAIAFDLDAGTNIVAIKNRTTSSTGVTNLDISAFNLTAKIYNLGSFASPITNSGTYTIPTALCYGGVLYYNDTDTATLPPAVDGMSITIYVTGTNLTTIDPDGTDVIVVDGTANAAGDAFTVAGAAGNFVSLSADADNHWVTLGAKGTLTAL